MKVVKIVLVGASGYAKNYLNYFFENPHHKKYCLCGVVDPFYRQSDMLEEMRKRQIPIYETIEAFYECDKADLVIVCTPPHIHKAYTIKALANGSHVLCEKPICPTVEEALEIIQAKEQTGKEVFIAFQMSFADSNLQLKQCILEGKLGKAIQIKSLVCWPRSWEYYKRNNWAGRVNTIDGEYVYDTVVNNATAHYLHNMLFLLGQEMSQAAELIDIKAATYRVNKIETFDLCTLKGYTKDKTEVLFYTTHASKEKVDPMLEIRFQKAVVKMNEDTKGQMVINHLDGTIEHLPNPNSPDEKVKEIDKMIDWVSGETTIKPTCTIETALPHLKCSERLNMQSTTQVISKNNITEDIELESSYIVDLEQHLIKCYNKGKLPYECGYKWAVEEQQI